MISGRKALVRHSGFPELQDLAVDTESQACFFLRAIIEDVPQVTIAFGTENFHPAHAIAEIRFEPHILSIDGLEKAWPTRARFKLCVALEQRKVAANAVVGAFLLVVQIPAAEGGFRSLAPQNPVLLFRQPLLPLRIAQYELVLSLRALVFNRQTSDGSSLVPV